MFVPFENLPQNSRIWVYQANRKIEKQELTFIRQFLTTYADGWAAHGKPLKASFDIRYDRFILLAVDENFISTSGCSIDDSVRAIKEIEQKTGIGFFDRQQVAFLEANDEVEMVALHQIKEKLQQGMLKPTTLAFNNLINAKFQLQDEWIVPLSSSWLKRYLPSESIKT